MVYLRLYDSDTDFFFQAAGECGDIGGLFVEHAARLLKMQFGALLYVFPGAFITQVMRQLPGGLAVEHRVAAVHHDIVASEVIDEVGVLMELQPYGIVRTDAAAVMHLDQGADPVQQVGRAQAPEQDAGPVCAECGVVFPSVFQIMEPLSLSTL